MKIAALRTCPLSVPYLCEMGAPFSTTQRLGMLAVLLETGEGIRGESVLFALDPRHIAILDTMVGSIAPLVVGHDPTFAPAIVQAAQARCRPLGPTGVSSMGIGAIDSALLDLRAKAAGLPVHRLLGAVRDRLPAYYSGALWIDVGLDDLQLTAERIVAGGYRAMKLRVGPGALDAQVARVRAIREAVGPSITLMVDVNQRLDEAASIRLGRAIEPYGIEWLEEPVPAHDHAAEARITAALDVAIASGETAFGYDEFAHMIEARCCDVLMPDLQRVGGPTEFLRIAARAAAACMPVSGHTFPEMSLALLAAIPNARTLEVMPWTAPVHREQIAVEDGMVVVPERPGWGYTLDDAALARYAA